MRLLHWFALALPLCSAALAAYTLTGRNLVTSARAREMIRAGLIADVVDVRTATEFGAGHYPGARHIPAGSIDARTTAGLAPRGILVYCNTGQRARFAAERLEALGFRDVYYIAGHYSSLT